MIIDALILIIGLIILAKASESSVRYSISVSRLLGISQMAVGCLIIAFITTLPEFSIAVISTLQGYPDLGIGNIIGCSIIDICLVFGVMAIFKTIKPSNEDYKELIRTISITSITAFIFILLKEINIFFGLFCLVVFSLFAYGLLKSNYRMDFGAVKYKSLKIVETIKSLNYLILSIIFVIVSSKFIVDSAVNIAQYFRISDALIGATVVATGATLPELAIAMMAVRKKKISLAIGDLVGSLVIHLTLVFGVISLITTVYMTSMVQFLLIFLLFTNMVFLFLSSTLKYNRTQGLILLTMYMIFMISAFAYQIFFI